MDLEVDEANGKVAFIKIHIQMDDEYKTTRRRCVSIADAFSNAGGLMSVVILVARILVQYIQGPLVYLNTLVNSFYLVQEPTKTRKIKT